MLTANELREAEKKDKEEYLVSFHESWSGAHRGAFRVDAIIVSNEKCKGVSLQGAADYRERMGKLFKTLDFRVTVLVDTSAEGLKTELNNIIANISEEFSNCFVCFASAYGNTERDGRHFIFDHEGNKVFVVEDIINPFMTCKKLDGKPKVFFINSCARNVDLQLLNEPVAEEPSAISLVARKPERLSHRLSYLKHKRDLLAVFSTEEEYKAGQDPGNGTRFIPALIDSLHQNHNNKDVIQIATDANRRCQAIPVIQSTLENKLFWRTRMLEDLPGIMVPPGPVGKRLLQVYETPNQSPEVDMVLFHAYEFYGKGWYPAALSSWFTKSPKPVCWPVEWLPGELGIPMRVFCVRYSESIENPEPCSSKRNLNELAEQVRKDLGELATKPLIFIAHGLGGLLIQEILNKEGHIHRLKEWLRGIVFYGVPYDFRSGPKENFSLPALENALQQENGYLSVMAKPEIQEALEPVGADSTEIIKARKNFKKYKEITLSFEEGKETHGSKINLVAAERYATQVNTIVKNCSMCNHFDICKPITFKEEIFSLLLRFMRKRLHNSDRTVSLRNIIVGQDVHREKLKKCLMTRGTAAAAVAGITGGDTFGVAGMGGIGKTTLAKSLFEDPDIRQYYDHRVYWIAVKKNPTIVDCQRRLISEICKEMPSARLDTEKLLLEELQRKLSKMRRVLLFLDDVWEKVHVDSLLGDSFMKTLPHESKCIITSRKPAELAKLDTNAQIEKLDVLNDKDARTLFCSKAFLNRKIPEDRNFSVVVEGVIAACGNLPILLASVGAERWGKKDIQSWINIRNRLRDITSKDRSDDESARYQELIEQLMISYDDLPEGDPKSGDGINFKDYFLDFAAFPEREEIEIAVLIDMWTKPGLTENGAYRILEELEQRSLVKIEGYWCHVHDIFRALAIQIVEEPPLKSRKRLFAWGVDNFRLEKWNVSGKIEDALKEEVIFETEMMVIARTGLEEFHPRDSILFKCLRRLRVLLLTSNLNLVSLPSAIGCMERLEKLDLSWCLGLKLLPPEIGQLGSLQKLNMAGCCLLSSVPREVGKLKKLMELNMQSCGVVELPEEIGELTSLTWLCLNDCSKLEALPESMGKLSSLVRLECDMLQIREIPKTLGDLSKLKYISFGECYNITAIPAEFVKLKNLISLWCVNTESLEVVPDVLDKLVTEGSLRVFNVYNTGVIWEHLPPNLHALPRPFDGTAQDAEADSTADNPDGPFWYRRRGMLVNARSLYDPSCLDERRLSFGLLGVVSLAKMEPFLSPRFNMAIRIMYTMANHHQTRHAIIKYGGLPVLLRCIAEGDPDGCGADASATLVNICVTISTHKAIVDAQGLEILTRALHRKGEVSRSAFEALRWIRGGDKKEDDFTFSSKINEICGHSSGHGGCACIWCQHCKKTFLRIENVF